MKELSIEEKAKAYDEALERAKKLQETCDSTTVVGWSEYIFPELKESEDERIRKSLIKAFGTIGKKNWGGLIVRDIVAWLEKQGEKPTDKVETKFKVGDWISGYYTNYKVTAIHSKGYMVEDTDGTKINILFENEKFHHLWTIQDAKDGDVLCYYVSATNFFQIAIFKRVASKDELWGQTYRNYVQYGGFGGIENYTLQVALGNNELHHCGATVCPATKEQRDLLFEKMKEAGYEWDTEKKELKKIETTAWSEEDEKIALSTEQVINCASLLNIVPDKMERIRTWLKTLKQRI